MIWHKKEQSDAIVRLYQKQAGVSAMLAKILLNRGVTADSAKVMLNTPLFGIQDANKIYGCLDAAQVINHYIDEENVQFFVYADYDVDGLMSGTIMADYLSKYRKTTVHFPERKEGYGLSMDWCHRLVENRPNGILPVVITVDNGIAKHDEVDYLMAHGIPVIVTDHHEPSETLGEPTALAVCDPKCSFEADADDERSLCGAGVAFYVCAMIDSIRDDDPEGERIRSYLPYVAVATVTDVMDMTHGNACLVNAGLDMINHEKTDKIAGFMDSLEIPYPLTTEEIGWEIGPRLNACGRMGNTILGAKYLSAGMKEDAFQIDKLNVDRKDIQKKVLEDAGTKDFDSHYVCIYVMPDELEAGIGGAVAGQLADKYKKPAIVLHRSGKLLKGSTRSYASIDLLSILREAVQAGIVRSAGGHSAASGIEVKENNISALQSFLDEHIGSLPADVVKPTEEAVNIDSEIALADVTKEMYEDINRIPYDKNCMPQPTFILPAAEVIDYGFSKKNQDNIWFELRDRHGNVGVYWAWRQGKEYVRMGKPKFIDLATTLKKSTMTQSFWRKNQQGKNRQFASHRTGEAIIGIEAIRPAEIEEI